MNRTQPFIRNVNYSSVKIYQTANSNKSIKVLAERVSNRPCDLDPYTSVDMSISISINDYIYFQIVSSITCWCTICLKEIMAQYGYHLVYWKCLHSS
jgi:hypothetical protein